ncbi:GNAT family N-acetyltransferase [Psychromonas ossibalaenae]|uniref:GNAT family N-acetyltransferase n=1 Tax=Psychromonas ossibalaenae TaxID=444922 RepID=UPI000368344E|nr:GNAT family N-acetyltransferase [Psychromonas ossibalaenae]
MTMKVIPVSSVQTLAVRHQVLWPDKSPEFCKVADDDSALHFAVVKNEQIICVASLFPDGKTARLRKFATLAQFQGQGAGRMMLAYILDLLIKKGFLLFWCDARQSACAFYQRFGLTVEGTRFYKSGVPYYKMAKRL